MKEYKYRGLSLPVSADIVGPELERIWAENGQQLQPVAIVDAARPPEALLHPCFEWDDSVAAEKFRLSQARQMTRNIQVVVENREPKTLFVHVSIADKDKRQRHYQHVDVLLDRPEEYRAALIELRKKLLAITQSFEELKQLAEKQQAADGELRKLGAIVEALVTARTVAERLQ